MYVSNTRFSGAARVWSSATDRVESTLHKLKNGESGFIAVYDRQRDGMGALALWGKEARLFAHERLGVELSELVSDKTAANQLEVALMEMSGCDELQPVLLEEMKTFFAQLERVKRTPIQSLNIKA